MMKIWKLAPADPTHPIWQDWKPDPIYVRAETADEARQLAKVGTIKMFPSRPGQPIPINPWGGHRKIGDPIPTTCYDVTAETNEYSIDGPAEVLTEIGLMVDSCPETSLDA